MSKQRVVVTGMGMVSPIGLNVADSWAAAVAGTSGANRIEVFDAEGYPVRIGANLKDFDETVWLDKKEARRMDPFIRYGLAAAVQAVEDAGIAAVSEARKERIGVAFGSGIGGIITIQNTALTLDASGPRKVSPFFVPASIINMIAGHVSIRYGFKGPNIAIATACTTGAHNIGLGARMIQYGEADAVVVGGGEMATSPVTIAAFGAMKALSTRNDEPERASRPWDRERDGFVLGDGAGALVLESLEHARERGATIYAELAGFGMTADAYHITAPEEGHPGAIRAMELALADAAMTPAEIGYINAHGTSTPVGDRAECDAIKSVFGATPPPVSSTKSMTGHLLGAAGAIEAIFSIQAMREGVLPPTINLDDPDDGCDIDLVPHEAREAVVHAALSNSFGFGGTNGTLIFKRAP